MKYRQWWVVAGALALLAPVACGRDEASGADLVAGDASAGAGGVAATDCTGLGCVCATADAAQAEPPSCRNVPLDGCGPGGDEDCCASPVVPCGSFRRYWDGATHLDDRHPASLSTFRLDRFEVTVSRYRAFVQAGGATQVSPPAPGAGAVPRLADSGWRAAYDAMLPADPGALSAALACGARATWTSRRRRQRSAPHHVR